MLFLQITHVDFILYMVIGFFYNDSIFITLFALKILVAMFQVRKHTNFIQLSKLWKMIIGTQDIRFLL